MRSRVRWRSTRMDLADVLELIRAAGLPEDLAARLDESVRPKYAQLWNAARGAPAG